MLKRTTLTVAALAALCTLLVVQVNSFPSGAPSGRTGAPGDQTCQNGCHNTFALNDGPGAASITTDIPVEGYTPGATYTVTLKVAEEGRPRFGFEALPYADSLDAGAGTISLTEPSRMQTDNVGNRTYVTHTFDGITQADSNSWSFDWTAPDEGTGSVTIYAAFVAGSGDNGNKQDYVYTAEAKASEKVATGIASPRRPAFELYAADGQLVIRTQQANATHLTLRVLTVQGAQVFDRLAYATAGEWETRIPTAELTPGVYLVQMIREGQLSTERVLIQ